MSRADLRATLKILKGPRAGECLSLVSESTFLGRDESCEFVLPRSTISRRHARIVRDDEGFFIEDLNSLNGTFVDSQKIAGQRRLHGGEHIQIDDFLISFRLAASEPESTGKDLKTEMFATTSAAAATGPAAIRSTFVGQFDVLAGAALRSEVDPQVKLQAVLDVIRNVGPSLNIDEVSSRVLDTLLQIFPQADHGCVFLADGAGQELTARAVKNRLADSDPSTTLGSARGDRVAQRVLHERQPLLCTVAPPDGEASSEVHADPVRAIIAAPIVNPRGEPVGVLQLDTEDAGRQFIDADLELLASIGALAGHLIEHAQLIDKTHSEAVLAREHAAAERERRWLREVLELLPVGVFISDARGKILEANPEGHSIWGGTAPMPERPADYAKSFPAWWPGTDRRVESHEFGLARVLATGEICRNQELEIETSDGRRRTILNYVRSIRDEGRTIGAVAVNVDITVRKRAEDGLTQANERKDAFLATLAHELRNPLAPLRNALAMIADRDLDDKTFDWARKLMDRQVEHMVRLVDDLLDVSRIERGKFNLRKEPAELSQVISAALETAQPLIESHQHRLHLAIPNEPVWLELDPVRMSQVVTNLLNNAAKYTEPEGQIWLTVEVAGSNELCIEVRDTGVGISAEILPRIFEPFTQADESLDRSQGGLGIGLSLVRRIVELHGGSVTVHSAGAGSGSTFTVRMPVIVPKMHVEPRSAPVGAIPARRVLVVDDQTQQAEVLAALLSKAWGHEVSVAHDGRAALAAIQEQRPDVVLLDIGLPLMNGFEVARNVRADPELQDILLVALSGYGQEEDQRRSDEAGFDLHLVKPPSLAVLKSIFTHAKLSQPTG